MNQSSQPEQQLQSILDRASVGGDLTVGDIKLIQQIIKNLNINQTHSGSGDNVAGNKNVFNIHPPAARSSMLCSCCSG